MKKLFLSVVATVLATVGFAQSNLVATLCHGDSISTFYGTDALNNAHSAAVEGDVITLSSGTFSAPGILNKGIVLRGAGMFTDTINGIAPTIVTGGEILFQGSSDNKLKIEGIYFNCTISLYSEFQHKNASFVRCRLSTVRCWYSNFTTTNMQNLSFINCYVSEALHLRGTVSVINCVVKDLEADSPILNISNSVLLYINGPDTSNFMAGIGNSTISNCYICTDSNPNISIPASTQLYNNVADYASTIRNATNTSNKVIATSNVFKTFRKSSSYNEDETFELTSEAASTYLGNDGTQVGIYGGTLPFDPTPTYPRLVKCNVAGKSAQDGTLSVELKIE